MVFFKKFIRIFLFLDGLKIIAKNRSGVSFVRGGDVLQSADGWFLKIYISKTRLTFDKKFYEVLLYA
jgi:hypothetical protein